MKKVFQKILDIGVDIHDSAFMKHARPGFLIALGVLVGSEIIKMKYNNILQGVEINAWDCWESGLTVDEFFKLLTPEMRISQECPTQLFIN